MLLGMQGSQHLWGSPIKTVRNITGRFAHDIMPSRHISHVVSSGAMLDTVLHGAVATHRSTLNLSPTPWNLES